MPRVQFSTFPRGQIKAGGMGNALLVLTMWCCHPNATRGERAQAPASQGDPETRLRCPSPQGSKNTTPKSEGAGTENRGLTLRPLTGEVLEVCGPNPWVPPVLACSCHPTLTTHAARGPRTGRGSSPRGNVTKQRQASLKSMKILFFSRGCCSQHESVRLGVIVG